MAKHRRTPRPSKRKRQAAAVIHAGLVRARVEYVISRGYAQASDTERRALAWEANFDAETTQALAAQGFDVTALTSPHFVTDRPDPWPMVTIRDHTNGATYDVDIETAEEMRALGFSIVGDDGLADDLAATAEERKAQTMAAGFDERGADLLEAFGLAAKPLKADAPMICKGFHPGRSDESD